MSEEGAVDIAEQADQEAPELEMPAEEETLTLDAYLSPAPPYPEERAARIRYFCKKRERAPTRFTFSESGDLEIRSKSGAVEETIYLRSYVPWEVGAQEAREQNRLDAIAMAESDHEKAMETLRSALAEFNRTGAAQPVLAAQARAAETDAVLSRVRYGNRSIQSLPNPETRDVLFDRPYEVRKLFPADQEDPFKKSLARVIVNPFPYMNLYGQYVDTAPADVEMDVDADKPAADESAIRQKLKDGRMARIFFDVPESGGSGANSFLSPFWPVEYTLGDTKYYTALQAFEMERAKEAGDDALRQKLLKTRSARTMRFLTKKLEQQPKDVKGLWLRIFTSIYQQHPELQKQLLATGTDALVFADTRKGPSGAGVGERDRDILDPAKWSGENAVGVALETLRYQMREGTAAEAALNAKPTEAVITEEEQQKARTGAIIGQARRFQFKRPGGPPA